MLRRFTQALIYLVGSILLRLFIKLTIVGRENLPDPGQPLIIVSNHFSWFEAPLLYKHLPYRPVFIAAVDLLAHPVVRLVAYAYEIIPIWRGQIDRKPLRRALTVLRDGGCIGIFPEGGIDPDLRPLTEKGKRTATTAGRPYRSEAQLIPARPGAAFIAVHSQAKILPVAFIGGEKVLPNLRRLRRTPVTMIIGAPFGPLSLDQSKRGPARREQMNALGDKMMRHIAALLPPENRGCYADAVR